MNPRERARDGRPRVSVIIPVFDRPEAIAALADTLRRQTMTDWEAVIVDDGSTADVAAAVRPWLDDERFRFLRLERNGGPAAARNRGSAAAGGDYVAFLDSDDGWEPDKLERQVALMEAEAGDRPAMCVTLTKVLEPGGWARVRPDFHPRAGQPLCEYLYCDGGYAQASSLMVTRDLLRTVSFCEDLRQYEDHLFYMALADAGARYLVVEAPLTTRDNLHRPDRLSRRDDLARGAAFVQAAGPLMTERARLAFGLRILGPLRLRTEPLGVLRDASRAVAREAIDLRALGAVLVNGLTPTAVQDKVQRWATRQAADR